jgi:hypothetical protein
MATSVLVATSLAAGVIAFVYGYVGFQFSQRPVSAEAVLGRTQFSLFWYSLGITSALTALESTLALSGLLSLSIAVTVDLVGVLIDCVFLWAIVEYLIYVYTGRYYLPVVGGFYGLFYVVALYYTILGRPYAVVIKAGLPTLAVHPVANPALELVVVIGLLFPEFIAAILYLSLLRRTRDRTQRFRIMVVGLSIITWFGLTFFYPSATVAETFEKSFLELIPALAVLVAYLPPEWMQKRFRILGIGSKEPT